MKSKSGLTLVELLIAISLLGMVVLSVASINATAERMLSAQNTQVRLANQTSYAIELIVRDILHSFGDPPGTTNQAFFIFDAGVDAPLGDELVLRREDVTPPQGADPGDRWVGYRLINNRIEFNGDRYGTGVWAVLIENVVDGLIFQAVDLNADGNAFNDQLIRINITCRQNPTQAASALNQEVNLVSAARIHAVSSQ